MFPLKHKNININNNSGYLKPFLLGRRWINNQRKSTSVWYNMPALKNNRAYILRTEIPKSHLNSHFCQLYGIKTSTVISSFYHVSNISLYCNDTIPSLIGNLWRVLSPGNHFKMQMVIKLEPVSLSNKKWTSTLAQDWLFWRKNATENA